MDFEDWNMDNPAPMQSLCGLIGAERKKAWEAALHSISHLHIQPCKDSEVEQLRNRCHELYSQNGDLKDQIKAALNDNAVLLTETKELEERLTDDTGAADQGTTEAT